MKIDFIKPNINNSDIQRMVKSVKSGWLAPGEYVSEFEEKLGKYLKGKAVMVNSCTSALHIALILAGIKEGDEVITTPLSWVATSNVILYMKAKPVFVDVEEFTGLIDPEEVRKKITRKTKAIIIVHLYGQMCDIVRLKKIAKGIPIIEDAAHALEAERDGYHPGQLGFAACFSFHVAKNITCGNGGVIVCKYPEKAKLIRRQGVINRNGKRVMIEFGYKYEPTDFQAALLIGQLKRIKKSHLERKKVFEKYKQAFGGIIKFPNQIGTHACHLFVIWVKNRDKIRKALLKKGTETSIHYSPIHLEPYYQKLGFKKGSLPIAEKLGSMTMSLPTYPMSKKQQDYIIKNVLKEV